jgi:hypothetical protein
MLRVWGALLATVALMAGRLAVAGDDQFSLVEGKGVPVCTAYLELLNKTDFDRAPFCGRPDQGVAGFEPLERHYLDEDEIFPLFTPVFEFMRFNDSHHVERFLHPNPDRSKKGEWTSDPVTKSNIANNLRLHWQVVWTYSTPLDINNNGTPVRVLLWQGYGAADTAARCGSDAATRSWDFPYVDQRGIVLTSDGKAIDEEQTRSIFGSHAKGVNQTTTKPFVALSDSIGVFKYAGRFYIETEDRPRVQYDDLPPVRVFLREGGKARQVCVLQPLSVPIPQT